MHYFLHKEEYVLRYENLQLYLMSELKLKKELEYVLEFNQSQWLKPYLDLLHKKK